jgi:hypothetical protein
VGQKVNINREVEGKMKNIITALACILLLLPVICTAADNRANLVPNPGFEDGKTSPAPWIAHHLITGAWAEHSKAEWTSDVVHSGKKAVKVEVTKNPGRSLGWRVDENQLIPVTGGKKLKASGWMKTAGITMGANEYCAPAITVATFDGTKKFVKSYWIGRALAKDTDWTKYESTIQLPKNIEYIQVSCALSACTGTAWYDDLEVVYVDEESVVGNIIPVSGLQSISALDNSPAPIIIPMPWKESYGDKFITPGASVVVADHRYQNSQTMKELAAVLYDITGSQPDFVSSLSDNHMQKTVVVLGRFNDPVVEKYLGRLKIKVDKAGLGEQGYVLAVGEYGKDNIILLAGNAENGIYYAVQSLKQYYVKDKDTYKLVTGIIIDKPDYLWRGLVPGNVGLARIDKWMVPLKVNVIFGPSDKGVTGSYDWWRPFTVQNKADLAKLVAECNARFISTVGGTRPDRGYVRRIRFSSQEDTEAILQKYRDYYASGIRVFALSYDDGPANLEYAEDKAEFKNLAQAHTSLAGKIYNLLKELNPQNKFVICPQHYYNPLQWSDAQKEYIRTLSELPKDIVFINCGTITEQTAREFVKLTGHQPLDWDNWAANFEQMNPIPCLVPPPADKNDPGIVKLTHGYMFPLLDKELMWYLASDYMWNASRTNPDKSLIRALQKLHGKENVQKIMAYQQFITENSRLPIQGSTSAERIAFIKKLAAEFAGRKEQLKNNIPGQLYKEIESTIDNRTALLEKIYLPQEMSRTFPLEVPGISTAPIIDGKLDDADWGRALKLTGFKIPLKNSMSINPAAVSTEARLMHDKNFLYVAFICTEPSMNTLKAKMTERDSDVYADDCVEIMLAPAGNPGQYCHWAVNSNQVIYDALVYNGRWNSNAVIRTGKQADKWIVEMAIPFKEIGSGKDWRFNLYRSRYAGQGKAEVSSWAVVKNGFHEPERFWGFRLK